MTINLDKSTAARERVEAVYRAESRRVLATLIRLVGDFETAEEALHDAFAAALEQWPQHGIPSNPRAWLVSTGRFKAIDVIRRCMRFDAALTHLPIRRRFQARTPKTPPPKPSALKMIDCVSSSLAVTPCCRRRRGSR